MTQKNIRIQVVEAYPVLSAAELSECEQNETVNEAGLRNFLMAKSWPNGLQECLIRGVKKIPIRYFICDDSGSMSYSDGKQIVKVAGGQDV